MEYTEFDYQILVTQLRQYSDIKCLKFQIEENIGSKFLYGVKIPKLRYMAKHIANRDWRGFMSLAQDNSFEEIMLQGMVLNLIDCDIEERFKYTDEFVKKIDNWSICDTFCASFKAARDNRAETWSYLQKYVKSDKEFEKRFTIVMLTDHFLIDGYVNQALEIILNMDKSEYYAMMAGAWAISAAFVKYRDRVLGILKNHELDPVTHNKAISKCCDSYRVSPEDKELLKTLRVKLKRGKAAEESSESV